MGVTFSLPSRWGHVQGLRAHPSSSTCMTEACKRCGHPAGEESGTQVCLLGSSLFINSLLHMRRYWRNIAYILIYLRRGFSTSDRKIKWCMSSLRKGDSQPLGSAGFFFFFFFGYRKPNVRLKSFEKSSFEARGFFRNTSCFFTEHLWVRVLLLNKVVDSKGCLTMW